MPGEAQTSLPDDQELRPRRQGNSHSTSKTACAGCKTDVIDLWQFHEINYDNDPDWIVEQRRPGRGAQGPEGGQGPLHRLHRPQVAAHPSEDARPCTTGTRCRCRSTCAIRITAASSSRWCPRRRKRGIGRHRHEEPGRRRAASLCKRRSARPRRPHRFALSSRSPRWWSASTRWRC